jgi:hypothetical protein
METRQERQRGWVIVGLDQQQSMGDKRGCQDIVEGLVTEQKI